MTLDAFLYIAVLWVFIAAIWILANQREALRLERDELRARLRAHRAYIERMKDRGLTAGDEASEEVTRILDRIREQEEKRQ